VRRERESWKTNAGFVLAAAGSAIGLGNMWRFAYLAASNGGAAFIFLYLGVMFLVGVPIMLAEFVIGRGGHASPVAAVAAAGGRAWLPLGWLCTTTGVLILSYYSVVAGWTLRYSIEALRGGFGADASGLFSSVATGASAVFFHLLFMALTCAVVARGIRSGIERCSVILMPVLFLTIAGLAAWAATLPGRDDAYSFYLRPHPGRLLTPSVVVDAAGQAFFSLSLGMGAMMTYASYLDGNEDLGREAVTISLADFAVALLAGLAVFPVIFTFGLEKDMSASPVGTLFIALPRAFANLGGAGRVVGPLFFLMLVVAALTSSISMLEVVTSSAVDYLGWPRWKAAWAGGLASALLGVPSALRLGILEAADKLVGNILLLVGGLFLALLAGWRMRGALAELLRGSHGESLPRIWIWVLRTIPPVVISYVLWNAIFK